MAPVRAPAAVARRARRGAAGFGVAAGLGLAAVALLGASPALTSGQGDAKTLQSAPLQHTLGALRLAMVDVEELRYATDLGHVLPKFGARAQAILDKAGQVAGPAAAGEVQQLLDVTLEALFLQQVALVSESVAEEVKDGHGRAALAQADAAFLAQVEPLVRPGSAWSYDQERQHLRARVQGSLQLKADLIEERARAAQLQQATMEVISQVQVRMGLLSQKLQAARNGGSPLVLSTSYRIPNTPLQLVGRYDQGRANVELNLTPDRNPSKSEASFVEGIGPANIGVSFNVGL